MEKIWHRRSAIWTRRTVYDLGEEILVFSWAAFQKSAISVVKKFEMAEGNFITNNARSVVKEFATENVH